MERSQALTASVKPINRIGGAQGFMPPCKNKELILLAFLRENSRTHTLDASRLKCQQGYIFTYLRRDDPTDPKS